MAILAALLAKLLDPVTAALAIVSGAALARNWWQVILAALVVAAIQEALLWQLQHARTFDLVIFLIGFVAAAIWVAAAYLLKRVWSRRRSKIQT